MNKHTRLRTLLRFIVIETHTHTRAHTHIHTQTHPHKHTHLPSPVKHIGVRRVTPLDLWPAKRHHVSYELETVHQCTVWVSTHWSAIQQSAGACKNQYSIVEVNS